MADPTLSASGERRLPTPDPWQHLRQFTRARIGLGRAGSSLPTGAWLRFKLDHAMARDAVHQPFDADTVSAEIETLGRPVLRLFSAAHDRATYLRRPDLGRRLEPESARRLTALLLHEAEVDVSVIVSDGLSARAVHENALPVLEHLLPALDRDGWSTGPVVVVPFARVAVQDPIGEALRAECALILLGERPGLGAPDSLGAYLVRKPQAGNTDADRNCVSNIRLAGLHPQAAAGTIHYLLTEMRRRRISGVQLKDERPTVAMLAREREKPGS